MNRIEMELLFNTLEEIDKILRKHHGTIMDNVEVHVTMKSDEI